MEKIDFESDEPTEGNLCAIGDIYFANVTDYEKLEREITVKLDAIELDLGIQSERQFVRAPVAYAHFHTEIRDALTVMINIKYAPIEKFYELFEYALMLKYFDETEYRMYSLGRGHSYPTGDLIKVHRVSGGMQAYN